MLAIATAPAGLAAPPPPPGPAPAPVAVALQAAAAATGSELSGRIALAFDAWPPGAPLAGARAWQDRVVAWRDRTVTLVAAAAAIHAFSTALGGPLAATDRVLDAAALLAIGVLALRLARRPRARPPS
jgi:hypothetical protein